MEPRLIRPAAVPTKLERCFEYEEVELSNNLAENSM